MLTIDDAVKDFAAVCERVDYEGTAQPPFVPTVAQNLVDLGPSETHDVLVRLWVRRSAFEEGLDPVLEAAVREWVVSRWPFERVTFAERDR